MNIIFNFLSCGLSIGFIITLINDYKYVYPYGSAPFYLYVLNRVVMFIVPSLLCLFLAKYIKNKKK